METDRNLLFGVLALQADLIDTRQFIEACTLWTARKHVALADLLVERGWILEADKAHMEYLLQRKLQKHAGDARAGLASVDGEIKRSLAALGDPDIHHSLIGLPDASSFEPADTVDFVPTQRDRYSLVRLHASGGVGRVWLARDSVLNRDVALKELRPERAHDSKLWARFLNEAQITGQLEHPGIVPVYELGRRPENSEPFYTMRFVKGRTLSQAICDLHGKRAAGEADLREFLALLSAFVTVCNTVAFAHSRGVIHRDLKGQNVILGDFGEAVVLDWGMAKWVGSRDPEQLMTVESGASGEPSLTLQGQALGTPAYMAPEQAAGRLDEIDSRTDVYGLGAMLYEILTGQPPFLGSVTSEVLRQVREDSPLPPSELWPDAPAKLDAACLQALAKRPDQRQANAIELAQQVQQHLAELTERAETVLRQSEAFYHSLVETLPLCVWRKDRESRFTFANERFCKIFHRSLSEIIGKNDFDFFPAELANSYRANDAVVLDTGQPFKTSEIVVGPEGELLQIRVIKTPVLDSRGAIIGTQGIFWDVTDHKKLQDELDETKAELSRVRHTLQEML